MDILLAERMRTQMDFSGLEESDSIETLIDESTEIEELNNLADINRNALLRHFDYDSYPTKDMWIAWMIQNFKKSSINIKTASLNQYGHVVRDTFKKYLDDTKYSYEVVVSPGDNGDRFEYYPNDTQLSIENGEVKGFLQSSHIKSALKTPLHLYHKIHKPVKSISKNERSFRLGESIHAMILEPTRFSRFYVLDENCKRNTDTGVKHTLLFWEDVLFKSFLNTENDVRLASEKTEAWQILTCEELGIITKFQVHDVYQKVSSILTKSVANCKVSLDLEEIRNKSSIEFEKIENSSLPKKSSFYTTIKEVVKQLGYKKNQELFEEKKTGWDRQPALQFLTQLSDSVAIQMNELKSISIPIFKNNIDTLQYCDKIIQDTDSEFMPQAEYDICKEVLISLKNYGGGIINRFLIHSKKENSIYVEDFHGVPVKIRPDAMVFEENFGFNAIISVKTTKSQTLEKFFRDAIEYDYHTTEAMYQEVATYATKRDFKVTITVVVQTVEPYGVWLVFWKPEDILLGRERFYHALDITREALHDNSFKGYDIYAEPDSYGMIDSNLPKYAFKELPAVNLIN